MLVQGEIEEETAEDKERGSESESGKDWNRVRTLPQLTSMIS